MERTAFKLLHDLENTWWYEGRAGVVKQVLKRLTLPSDAKILDFGAGFGGMFNTLSQYGSVSAFEPEAEPKQLVSSRGYTTIYDTADSALSTRYDLIALFDVLEHIEDDRDFLVKAHRAMPKGGALILTVPALPFLWSTHDVTHHHYRRYTPETLRAALHAAGFEVQYLSFWNMLLLAPAALARVLGRTGETSFALPRGLDRILYFIVRCETLLMRLVPLPIGISLVVVARKK